MIKRMSEEDEVSVVSEEEEVIDLDEQRVCVDFPRYSVFRIGDPKERVYDNETRKFMNVYKSTSHNGKKCEKHYWQLVLFDEDGVKHKVQLSRIVSKTWIPNPN